MSTYDLFEDGFPHGTPDGYRNGCRGSACPAGVEHGLSCRVAYQKAAGDYRYGRLAAAGHTPAEIAVQLGITTTPHEAPKKRAPRITEDDEDEQDDTPTTETDLEEETMTTTTEAPSVPKPTPATIAKAVKPKRKSPAGPSQSDVRAWAHANGVEVNARGAVRRDVVDQYLAAQTTPPTPSAETEPAPAETSEPVDGTEPATDATPDPVAETPRIVDVAELVDYARTSDLADDPLVADLANVAEQLAQLNAHLEHLREERDEARHALTFALRQWHEARTTAALTAIHLADARAAERTLMDALQQAEDDLVASRALANRYQAEATAAAARPWWKKRTA